MKNDLLARYTQEKSKEIVSDIRTPNLSDLDFLEADSADNKVTLIGNWHGIQEVRYLFVKLIMYLNQFGYKDIILEKPIASEHYYNKYLDTGDEKYWPSYLDPGPFKVLYNWNKALPKSRKIRIWCVDVDQHLVATSMCLNEYVKTITNKKLRNKISKPWYAFEQSFLDAITECLNRLSKEEYGQITSLMKKRGSEANMREAVTLLSKWFHSICEDDIKRFLQNMTRSLMQRRKGRLDYLFRVEDVFKRRRGELISITGGEAYERSFRTLRALIDTMKMESAAINSHDFVVKREEFLKNCIRRVFTLRKKGKFLGFFGSWHIAKSSDDGTERVGKYITKRYGRKRVYSLYLAVYSGEMCNSFTGKTYTIPKVEGFEGVLAHAVSHNMFSLPIEESFFKENEFLARFGQKISHEYYDGCVFIRKTHKLRYSFIE